VGTWASFTGIEGTGASDHSLHVLPAYPFMAHLETTLPLYKTRKNRIKKKVFKDRLTSNSSDVMDMF